MSETVAVQASKRPIDLVKKVLDERIKGDDDAKMLTFLVALSSYTKDWSLSLNLKGPSSIGKTFNAIEVTNLFPPDDVWILGGMSPTALVHGRGELEPDPQAWRRAVCGHCAKFRSINCPWASDNDPKVKTDKADECFVAGEKFAFRYGRFIVDLTGKILVFIDSPHKETLEMLRPILSHDKKEIVYKITNKTKSGSLRTMETVVRGWPSFIFATASPFVIDEHITRSFTVSPESSEEKFGKAIEKISDRALDPFEKADPKGDALKAFIADLKDQTKQYRFDFIVPYAKEIERKFPRNEGRLMRDYSKLFNLIKAHAFLNVGRRWIITDVKTGMSAIVAEREDFEAAKKLFAYAIETTTTGLSKATIEFFEEALQPLGGLGFTVEQIRTNYYKVRHRPLSGRMVNYYMDPLVDAGWVDKSLEKGKNVYTLNVSQIDPSTWAEKLTIPDAYPLPDVYNNYVKNADTKIVKHGLCYSSDTQIPYTPCIFDVNVVKVTAEDLGDDPVTAHVGEVCPLCGITTGGPDLLRLHLETAHERGPEA